MESYEKLVRDKIPEILDTKGVPYEKHTATEEEFRNALIKKLAEEVGEFSEAGSPEELADVLEVIEALRKLPEYQDVENFKAKKRGERGGFDDKIILKGQK